MTDKDDTLGGWIEAIRKTVPNRLARDITNIQPMTGTGGFSEFNRIWSSPWCFIGVDTRTDSKVFHTNSTEIIQWIESQPVHMWKFYDVMDNFDDKVGIPSFSNYVFTKEMEAWFIVRWS